MLFWKNPRLESQHEWQWSTGWSWIDVIKWKISWRANGSIDNIEENIPKKAIITLAEWVRVISQRWLATQPPPAEFLAAWGEVFDKNNPHSWEKDYQNKMQCWHKNGIWYWNRRWRDWLAKHYGWYIPQFQPLVRILQTNMQRDKDATMARMWVVKSGYFDYSGEIFHNEGGYIASSSIDDYHSWAEGLRFDDESFQLRMQCFLSNDSGTVPFIVLNA